MSLASIVAQIVSAALPTDGNVHPAKTAIAVIGAKLGGCGIKRLIAARKRRIPAMLEGVLAVDKMLIAAYIV